MVFFGMIVPLSITFNSDFSIVRKIIHKNTIWHSSYDNIPDALFDGVSQRCTILLNDNQNSKLVFSTRMYRWKSEYRLCLFDNLIFQKSNDYISGDIFLKSSNGLLEDIWRIMRKAKEIPFKSEIKIMFSNSARNYLSVFIEPPPCLKLNGDSVNNSKKQSSIKVNNEEDLFVSYALLGGNVAILLWLLVGDGMDVTSWNLIPIVNSKNKLSGEARNLLSRLGKQMYRRRFECLQYKLNAGKYVGSFCYQRLFEITKRSDLILLSELGFSANDALIFDDIYKRTFSINLNRGEKAIPDHIRNKFPELSYELAQQEKLFDDVDKYLIDRYLYSNDLIDAIIYS